MKKAILLHLIISVLLFCSCGHKIKRGAVIDKYWYEGYYYTTIVKCGDIYVPMTNYMPPSYSVKIRGIKNSDTVTSTYGMYLSEWKQCNIGDTLFFN